MFKTTYLVFYTSVFLTLARFSTYITNEVLWCSKNLYFKKLFYLRKTNSLYLEKLLLLLISNASSRMQSSSPHAGLVVFTAPKLRPRPAATASLPHGISFDESDSCRTLPKWNLCNQAFLCCSICFFPIFFSQHRHLLPVALQPLVVRMDFILVMFDAPWMLGCSQSHSTFCLLALLGWNNLCRLHLSRLVWSYL